MNHSQEPEETSVLDGLSPGTRAMLRDLDVVYDSQLPTLRLEELALPHGDARAIREAVAGMEPCEEPDLRPLVGGITREEVDLDPKEADDERV